MLHEPPKIGQSHLARKALFRRGVANGYLTVEEIEEALPAGSLTPAERWLLYYSLRAAEVEIVGERREPVSSYPEAEGEAAAPL